MYRTSCSKIQSNFSPVITAAAAADDDDDVAVLNGQASYTLRLIVTPRTAHLLLCKCFNAKKLMSYLDLSALQVNEIA